MVTKFDKLKYISYICIMKTIVPLQGFPNYLIDKEGNIYMKYNMQGRITDQLRIKVPKLSRHGYIIIQLNNNGKRNTRSIHRLLAIQFIPNPNNYRVVNHINGIKSDNRLENLEWCTDQYNTLHYHRIIKGQI